MHHDQSPARAMGRVIAVAGALAFAVALGFGAFSYLVVFARTPAPWSAGGAAAAAADFVLFGAFALHHSLFARLGVKDWVARLVSSRYERTVYVWIASVLFIGVCGLWLDVPGVAWHVTSPWSWPLAALQVVGVVMTLQASQQLDVLNLAGVRQATGDAAVHPSHVIRRGLYGVVRHPIYLAWALMVWPTPFMTGTRLTFAAVTTLYLAVAVPFEERTLRREFGPEYDAYARDVRWRIVPFVY